MVPVDSDRHPYPFCAYSLIDCIAQPLDNRLPSRLRILCRDWRIHLRLASRLYDRNVKLYYLNRSGALDQGLKLSVNNGGQGRGVGLGFREVRRSALSLRSALVLDQVVTSTYLILISSSLSSFASHHFLRNDAHDHLSLLHTSTVPSNRV